eukprot:4987883-Pyramimonas_sp.AAC.1
MAPLKGLSHQELAEATGENKNAWCAVLRHLDRLRCFELSQDPSATTSRSTACSASSQVLAPRTRPEPTSYDEEFETSSGLFTAKHAADIKMAGAEDTID